MVKNFVSVSGITDKQQLEGIHAIYAQEGLIFPVVLGYQVSNKSINQGTHNPRQPRFAELGDLCRETVNIGLIPAIHYYTKDNDTILRDLEKVVATGVDPNSSLIQFNTLPPTREAMKAVKDMGFEIIFKVAVSNKQSAQGGYAVWKGDTVQDVDTGEVAPLVGQVIDRADAIDYAMFDPSHGTNLDLNLNEDSLAIRFGKALTAIDSLDNIGLVYAGGIKPSNVKLVARSVNAFFPGRISIDIESGVRRDDILDLELVRAYFVNYLSAFDSMARK
jgi:phosphoribosylanthranilate isomerase